MIFVRFALGLVQKTRNRVSVTWFAEPEGPKARRFDSASELGIFPLSHAHD